MRRTLPVLILSMVALACSGGAPPETETLVMASTTSTRDSGLLDEILPKFQADTGIAVRVVAVGTGRALDLARRGDADVLLVHDRASEEAFVADGHGLARHPVMYNDFVIVGPAGDPAGIRGMDDVGAALARVARSEATFLSRGDDSGTHKAERRLWAAAGLDPTASGGGWYRETGSGMGATLNTASQLPAYTLTDRGTWLSFRNRGGLDLLVEGDPRLRNEYGVIVVSPERHPHVKAEAGRRLVEWLTGDAGRAAIAAFRVAGEPLFFPVETRSLPVERGTEAREAP
jgi:tungstate transport system substrate-binding protein